MNTTTAITLNDRFSMIKKSPSANSNVMGNGRARSRSRSRNRRQQGPAELRGSRKSQQLLKLMERQHKMRVALKLKNKSILTSRGRFQGQIIRNQARLAGVVRKTMSAQMLKRGNSQTRFIPLNDAPSRIRRGRSRSRSRSRSRNRIQNTGSIQDRLGIRKVMGRMRRSFQQQNGAAQQRGRSRSRSRTRLNRNNFKPQQQNTLRRSNSVNARLGINNRPVRNRSRSRNNFRQQNTGQLRRSGSINARLGNARRRNPGIGNRINQNQFNRPMNGRIMKRKINRKIGIRKANAIGNAAARNAKKLQRGNNQQARGRARTRGGQNNQGNQQQRRGRSRTRRANQNRGGQGGKGGKPKISKAQLDKQLDEYMANA